VLAEVARLLRPQGRFLFTVPGPAFHANLRGSILPWVSRQRYLNDIDHRLAHVRYPTSSEWSRLCEDAGLCLAGCLGYLDQRETRCWETLSRLTGGLAYAIYRKQRSPIRIQRQLGLRQLQNRSRMPSAAASALTAIIWRSCSAQRTEWVAEPNAGCLLVHGTRRCIS
jgi:SAM-dependent methyltransferase